MCAKKMCYNNQMIKYKWNEQVKSDLRKMIFLNK